MVFKFSNSPNPHDDNKTNDLDQLDKHDRDSLILPVNLFRSSLRTVMNMVKRHGNNI